VCSLRKLLILILFFISPSISANETITLAAENSWPPYSDKNGNGISKDIIQAAFNAVNVNVEFITVPYARALKMAENGQVDGAFNVTKQKSTIEKFNFGEVPIFKVAASFYYHNDSKLNFSAVNDIPKEISVGVIIGYEYGDNYEVYKDQFKVVKVANQFQLIGLLLNKRIDMAIMFDDVAKIKLHKMGLKYDDIRKGKVNHISDIYVAFSKVKDTNKAMKLLDKGLTKIKAEVH